MSYTLRCRFVRETDDAVLVEELDRTQHWFPFSQGARMIDEAQARKILGDTVQPDNTLRSFRGRVDVDWPNFDAAGWQTDTESCALSDCDATADELEAIAWWMRNMKVKD